MLCVCAVKCLRLILAGDNENMKTSSKSKKYKISNIIAGVAAVVFLLLGCLATYARVMLGREDDKVPVAVQQAEGEQSEVLDYLDTVNQNQFTSTEVGLDAGYAIEQCVCFGFGIVFLLYVLRNKEI